MNRAKIHNIISLILNLTTAILVAVAIGSFWVGDAVDDGIGNMKTGGAGCLIFFTNDSNILAAITSLIIIFFNIKALISGKNYFPKWALMLKFIGTTAVTVTLTVVLLFLGPIMGYRSMFEGSCFLLHLICPLTAIISFCFFEHGPEITKRQTLLCVLPTVIYGTIYLTNVIFIKIWPDFYNFNLGGLWPVSYIVMTGVTYLLALGLRRINKTALE